MEHAFLFQLTLTINITPINIALSALLEKNKIKRVLRAIGHAEIDPNFYIIAPSIYNVEK